MDTRESRSLPFSIILITPMQYYTLIFYLPTKKFKINAKNVIFINGIFGDICPMKTVDKVQKNVGMKKYIENLFLIFKALFY